MSVPQIILGVVLILLTIAIIVLIFLQEGNQQGLSGAISGGSSDSFFGKNKGRTNEAKAAAITKLLVGIFLTLVLVSSIVLLFV